MIKAEIVKDSLAPSKVRLTTFVLTYPRFIHAEFMTHRMFSRNASSSRAIPVSKQIQMVKDNPVIPLAFTKNKKGMQGGEALNGESHDAALKAWLDGRDRAVEIAERLAALEVHKQYSNRILESYSTITVVCTATDFDNFFALRCHPAAQPEICELANRMYDLYVVNKPEELSEGSWHLPFITEKDCHSAANYIYHHDQNIKLEELLIKKSVAKCARVSYLNHDGSNTNEEQDLQLYNRLLGEIPIHASPAEHQAMALSDANVRSGNFKGWRQYRKTLENERVTKFVRS